MPNPANAATLFSTGDASKAATAIENAKLYDKVILFIEGDGTYTVRLRPPSDNCSPAPQWSALPTITTPGPVYLEGPVEVDVAFAAGTGTNAVHYVLR